MMEFMKIKTDNLQKGIKIAVITNITLDIYLEPIIKKIFAKISLLASILPISYVLYNSEESQLKLKQADIIVICLNFDSMFPNAMNDILSNRLSYKQLFVNTIKACNVLYDYIVHKSNTHIIWFGFEDYFYRYSHFKGFVSANNSLIGDINIELIKLITERSTYIDLKRIIADIGIKNCFDYRNKYRWNAPYKKELIRAISEEIYKQYLIQKGITKKCLVLDCDNVLWGGNLPDDGIENVRLGNNGLGRSYQEFQRYLLSLFYHGIILTISSKNDLSDVMLMFHEHSGMILKEEHISCFRVNWDKKPDNIRKIAEILNIGLDSMVFIDDSDFEINLMKDELPKVTAIKYEGESVYEQLSCFNLSNNVNLNEVYKRNETYKTNVQREILKRNSNSYDEYLKALEMKVVIHEIEHTEYNRVVELTQRTNKCTNGKRYTLAEIKERLSEESFKCYSVSLSDNYSDLGIVGAICIDKNILDLFTLSCRALGRKIEYKMLDLIREISVDNYYFSSTGKNDKIHELFIEYFNK